MARKTRTRTSSRSVTTSDARDDRAGNRGQGIPHVDAFDRPVPEEPPDRKKPDTKYHWKPGERLGKGLKRIIREQLRLAIWELSGSAENADRAVHETRKCLKKARSAIRLIERNVCRDYSLRGNELRNIGRELSKVRDSRALVDAFDDIAQKYRGAFRGKNITSIRLRLVSRRRKALRKFEASGARHEVLRSLRRIARTVEALKADAVDFSALSKGLSRSFRKNLKAGREACAKPGPKRLHSWRKRAKELRHHLNLVLKVSSGALSSHAAKARDLEDKLGDLHNLSVLHETIKKNSRLFGTKGDVGAFLDVVDIHQENLLSDCRAIFLYFRSEPPKLRSKP